MSDKAQTEKTTPAYVPWRTFTNFSGNLKDTIPAVIDRAVMHSLSGTAQSQLLSALRFLKLIDNQNRTQELYRKYIIAEGDEQEKILQTILKGAYPFLFDGSGGFDLTSGTSVLLDKQLEANGATGQTTQKSRTFFMHAARDAGLTLSKFIVKKGAGTRKRRGGNNGGGRQYEGRTPPTDSAPSDPQAPANLSDVLADFMTWLHSETRKLSAADRNTALDTAANLIKRERG